MAWVHDCSMMTVLADFVFPIIDGHAPGSLDGLASKLVVSKGTPPSSVNLRARALLDSCSVSVLTTRS